MARMQRGFTLAELLVVVSILGLVGIYFGRSLKVNEQAYRAVDETVESQQVLRAVTELLERDIRHAGLMMPEGAAVCGVDATSGPDTLYLADGAAIDPRKDTEPYPGASVTSGSLSGGTVTLTLDSLVIETTSPVRPAYDTDGDGANDSDFRVGGGVIVMTSDADLGTACGRITDVRDGSSQIDVVFTSAVSGNAIAGAVLPLVAVPANEYRLDGTRLLWNGKPMAGNIEDFQVAWVFDPDGDNVVDAGEVYGADGTTAYKASGNTLGTDYESAADIRELRTSFVARSRSEDDEFAGGRQQAFENRDDSTFAEDGYRRRVIQSRVRLRNVGMRFGA